jgi:hypothetical protein
LKIRRLSEIDLVRLASLTDQDELEHRLRAYNAGGGAWSYNPVRNSTSDILGASTPLLGGIGRPNWAQLQRQIVASCTRGQEQIVANLLVGKVLHEASHRMGWGAAQFHMGAMPIGIGETVRYWSDVVLEGEDGLMIPFFDHRREHGVANAAMRQVLFSMQHTWVRERHPDLAEAKLVVVRFPTDDDTRTIKIDRHHDAELLPYDVLDARVRNVYVTWARVSEEKARAGRKGTGTDGPDLFGRK